MAVAWPVGIDPPLVGGYGYTQADLLQRTGFAHGDDVRVLFTDDGDDFGTLSMLLTYGEWAFFQAWYAYDCHDGAKWFLMPLTAAGSTEDREARFTTALQWALVGKSHVRLSAGVETRVGTTPE